MGKLVKCRDFKGAGPHKACIIIVPGFCAQSLEEQTCSHFQKLIEARCDIPDSGTTAWIYDHGISPHSRQCWDAFCASSGQLLGEMLRLCERQPQVDLIVIGHRLGAFILKQALIDAHRRDHHALERSLFETLQTIIMIGDPSLHEDNRSEWAQLVSECLQHSIKLSAEVCSVDALNCLKCISDKFEDVTLHSQFFQVSGITPTKRRVLKFKNRTRHKGCLCKGYITVRMWSTADDDESIPANEGNFEKCIFEQESPYHKILLLIANGEYRPDGFDTLHLGVPQSTHVLGLARSTHAAASSHSGVLHFSATSNRAATDMRAGAIWTPRTEEDVSTGLAAGNDDAEHVPLAVKCGESTSSSLEKILPVSHDSNTESKDKSPEFPCPSPCPEPATSSSLPTPRSRPLPLRLRLPQRVPHFVGREDALDSLRSFFTIETQHEEADKVIRRQPKVLALQGVGGIGKTSVAVEYIHRYAHHFDYVFWIRARNEFSIARSFQELAISLRLVNGRRTCTHRESRTAFQGWLQSTNSTWIMVFDDADDPQILEPYFPNVNRGYIIVTTRAMNFDKISLGVRITTVELQPLSSDESMQLLLNLVGLPFPVWESDGILDIRALQGHPLALIIAAASINQCSTSYVDRLRRCHLLAGTLEGTMSARGASLQASLLLDIWTADYVNQLSEAANEFGTVLACLTSCHDDITERVILGAVNCQIPLRHFPTTDALYGDCKREMERLIETADGATSSYLCMNRSISSVFRARCRKDIREDVFETAANLVLNQWPSRRKLNNILLGLWPEFDDLHGHIHSLSEVWRSWFRDSSTHRTTLVDTYVQALYLYTWYNSRVRGNTGEDLPLIQLAHTLDAIRITKSTEESAISPPSPPQMPSRLLWIDPHTQKVKITNTRGQHLDYCALSYCWGEDTPELTTMSLSEYQKGVPLNSLPKLIVDACDLTILCGIRYLWVDRYCIPEDNYEERANQISQMSNIYKGSTITIMASFISDKIALKSGEISSNWRFDVGPYSVLSPKTDYWKRAWVYQEVYLSNFTRVKSEDGCREPYKRIGANFPSWAPDWSWASVSRQVGLPKVLSMSGKDIIGTELSMKQVLEWCEALRAPSDLNEHSRKEASSVVVTPTIEEGDRKMNEKQGSNETEGYKRADPLEEQRDERIEGVFREEEDRCENIIDGHTERRKPCDSLDIANEVARKSIRDWKDNRIVSAIGKLTQARDYTAPLIAISFECAQAYLQFSTDLSLLYLYQQCPELSIDLLAFSAYQLHNSSVVVDEMQGCNACRFHLATGDAQRNLGEASKARESFLKAMSTIADDTKISADLRAIAELKLADLSLQDRDFEDAQTLIKKVLAHFEVQETAQGQAQYARALYKSALIYEAEGRGKMKKRQLRAAGDELRDVCKEQGYAIGPDDAELTMEDFEKVLEFGFR